uniref:Uncharacterized protein n=1 Tax=Anguilla anguilla TaxID=7936 RepID=A0A0E9VPH9_ANGAN
MFKWYRYVANVTCTKQLRLQNRAVLWF